MARPRKNDMAKIQNVDQKQRNINSSLISSSKNSFPHRTPWTRNPHIPTSSRLPLRPYYSLVRLEPPCTHSPSISTN
ncbi:hypothetical protein BDZ91DRAFT_713752 [Kalaharituber pfeilii]|nr:hypothetical protein BDZ91DRAFT_713752 [Kalaharituber pfeilii]